MGASGELWGHFKGTSGALRAHFGGGALGGSHFMFALDKVPDLDSLGYDFYFNILILYSALYQI